jgi:hypothetical protein
VASLSVIAIFIALPSVSTSQLGSLTASVDAPAAVATSSASV